ncbi:hypothetical protein FA15DRAFT_674683 [Coprinopsis marcescibilis]|uniref:Extracellular membrane protein CFEM domain-containing protein n=1 Tax=Coprinopsis marcescibilis TaxID=230819 RepID=A0A5C3KGT2_COPMA|nr:hypothetical protein FA15DRAFT_674683 [Coprinopsis marcescibilis]
MRFSQTVAVLALGFNVLAEALVTRQVPPEDILPEECFDECINYLGPVINCSNEDYDTCVSCLTPLVEAGRIQGLGLEILETTFRSTAMSCATRNGGPSGSTAGEPTGDGSFPFPFSPRTSASVHGGVGGASRPTDSTSSPGASPPPTGNGDMAGGNNGSGAPATRGCLSFAAVFVAVAFGAFYL